MLTEGSGIGFEVGHRVLTVRKEGEKKEGEKKQSGTIKYIGPVEGYDGLWIGVDWDSGHGRHNGTVNGKRYFETTTQESGSLVRPHSLSAGVTLAEALIQRYHGRMNVELVGKDQIEEKQKRIEELKVVILAHAGVRSAGPRGEVAGLAPSIEELDLTGNLLPDWMVETLKLSLKSLEELHLCGNHIKTIQDARLSENPLVDPDLGTAARYLLVARIGSITSLNGSEVKPRERKEAEIRYVWNVLKTITGKISDSVLKVHPRLMELISKYDISVESAQPRGAGAFSKMSETLIRMVGRLKQVCEALFRVKAANQVLCIKDEERPLPILLDDLETIADIGVTEDSRILVDEAKGH
ncbi:hypothetical protein R1sor_024897 [Riccia sorocarpa]|uniref:CAP-Gly domain-containing protein n=1 Tax=Riccia sorocarpa TaxID=122646 RepID=A0ABD3GVW9_9MARC